MGVFALTYAALGYGGHAVYVVPGADLVFVHRVNTYARQSVELDAIRHILQAVLAARIGPAHDSPRLVPAQQAEPPPRQPAPKQVELDAYPGHYRHKRFEAHITLDQDRLELRSPNWGNYFLYPQSQHTFVAEDAGLKLEFEPGDTGQTKALRIWFNPRRPIELLRSAHD